MIRRRRNGGPRACLRRERQRHRAWVGILLALAVAVGGCSGGSGGSSERAPDSLRWPGQPTGKVDITAVDAFGSPVAGASVEITKTGSGLAVLQNARLTTDANGRAAAVFPAGSLTVRADLPGLSGYSTATLEKNRSLSLTVTLFPTPDGAKGFARAEVVENGVSADGTTLEFTVQLIGGTDVNEIPVLRPCSPDSSNDSPAFVADCVAGPAGFDAPYAGAESDNALNAEYRPGTGNVDYRYSATLMIGQDDQTVLADPGDQRLLAARHFFEIAVQTQSPVLLAAFASNDPTSGRPSLLPRQPVTLFPVDNPQFTTNGRSYFGALDTLATMEGGASPLLAAVGQMIDFNASVPGTRKPALVVVSGPGNDCGAATACRAQVLQLVERSRATGVPIVTVGMHAQGAGDPEVLGLLAGGANGSAAFWLDDLTKLPNSLRTLGRWLSGDSSSLEATFRIRSPVPGAFASGRVVKGEVVVPVCPWDCFEVPVPFVLRIP